MQQIWQNIKPKGDPYMWGMIFMLSIWGLFAVYSSTGALAYKKYGGNVEFYLLNHLMFVLMGFAIMFVVHSWHFKVFVPLSKLALYFSYLLLVFTLFFGARINDAQRWVRIPFLGVTFQTSDFAKVALIMYVSRELSRRQEEIKDLKKGFLPIFLHITVTCLLILPNNLSTGLVLFGTAIVVMFVGRVSLKHISALAAIGAVGLFLFLLVVLKTPDEYLEPVGRVLTWKHRVETFIHPSTNPDVTYQNDHAKIAIATGGLFGKGPGQSTERNFLPQAYADFIYAIIAEEYGFLGAVLMMLMYLFFMYRTLRIVMKSPKAFGALLAVGLSFALVSQALINMAVAVNLFPNTGLTLPLVSKGGTSMIFTSFAFGVIMSVSRYIEDEEPETQQLAENVVQESVVTV